MDILTEVNLCCVCKGYLSIPPIVYSVRLVGYVCGRCYSREMYSSDVVRRQYDYEKIASQYIFPCSNDDCDRKVGFDEHAKYHEEVCEYAQIKCPISNFFVGFLKPKEVPCYFRCMDEMQMIEHIKNNHTDYILTNPLMIRSSDILLDPESHRLLIMIYIHEYNFKMAVLTREKFPTCLKLQCRMIMEEPSYCMVDINPPTRANLNMFSCIPLDRPRYITDGDDESYKLTFSQLKKERILTFSTEEIDTSLDTDQEEAVIDAIKVLGLDWSYH